MEPVIQFCNSFIYLLKYYTSHKKRLFLLKESMAPSPIDQLKRYYRDFPYLGQSHICQTNYWDYHNLTTSLDELSSWIGSHLIVPYSVLSPTPTFLSVNSTSCQFLKLREERFKEQYWISFGKINIKWILQLAYWGSVLWACWSSVLRASFYLLSGLSFLHTQVLVNRFLPEFLSQQQVLYSSDGDPVSSSSPLQYWIWHFYLSSSYRHPGCE